MLTEPDYFEQLALAPEVQDAVRQYRQYFQTFGREDDPLVHVFIGNRFEGPGIPAYGGLWFPTNDVLYFAPEFLVGASRSLQVVPTRHIQGLQLKMENFDPMRPLLAGEDAQMNVQVPISNSLLNINAAGVNCNQLFQFVGEFILQPLRSAD